MQIDKPLDELYFEWLYNLVDGEWSNVRKSHVNLIRVLFCIPFEWHVPNDDNRAEDGRELRFEFSELSESSDRGWFGMECSFLEMLIALARRMSFERSMSEHEMFWEMVNNVRGINITDQQWDKYSEDDVRYLVDLINKRKYNYNGGGGIFPLRKPYEDQTKVEIIYQMSAYILENDPLYQ